MPTLVPWIVPVLTTVEDPLPVTLIPVEPLIVPWLTTLCAAVPVTVRPVCEPPLIEPLLTTPVAGEPTVVAPWWPTMVTVPAKAVAGERAARSTNATMAFMAFLHARRPQLRRGGQITNGK